MEATKMPIGRHMDKEVVVPIHNGILLNSKELLWVSSNEVDETESIIQSEISQKEKPILYINAYVWNLERR